MAVSFVLLLLEMAFMFLAVGYVLKIYKAPAVDNWTVVSTYLSWSLGFAGIVLLPFDIAVAFVEHIEMTPLRAVWDTIYWRLR